MNALLLWRSREASIKFAIANILASHRGRLATVTAGKIARFLGVSAKGVFLRICIGVLDSLDGNIVYDSAGRPWRLKRVYVYRRSKSVRKKYLFQRLIG